MSGSSERADVQTVCPNCGSPWMEGTGLYLCGEGVRGFVAGGCREHYTAQRIEKYGRVTHKQQCPHRTDPWHQGDPEAREDGGKR